MKFGNQDGTGFGFGIHHLTERIELLQGKLRYYGRNGFELIAELPIRRRYEDD